jgi:beta-glucosidase
MATSEIDHRRVQSDWEGEGADRENMDLPGHMNELISAVLCANSRTVVVMQSGTPVEMPWLPSAPAVVQAWYGGNEAGNGIADILFGDTVPSGKLPLSFPTKVQDNPAYLNYKSNRGRTLYGEDVFIGYRFYEASSKHVCFPFGHGLSYTKFSFQNLKMQQYDEKIIASLDVTNTGSVVGSEVAQMYISQQSPSVSRPPKELKGFTKVKLQPGETKRVTITALTRYATSFWDEGRSMWISERDKYTVTVSNSSACDAEHQVVQGEFEIKKTTWWKGL